MDRIGCYQESPNPVGSIVQSHKSFWPALPNCNTAVLSLFQMFVGRYARLVVGMKDAFVCSREYDGGMNWRQVIGIILLGSVAGAATSSAFILVHDILTRDSMLDLWEFGINLSVPALVAVVLSMVAKTRFIMLLVIAYLTFLIPVLGAVFGSSGSEPFWQFAMLGLIGGLGWSIPFALWAGRAGR